MATHKHWPKDHPRYDSAPVCDLPTKKACDDRYRAHKLAEKQAYEQAQAQRELQELGRREEIYRRYAVSYEQHVQNILENQ